MKTLQKLLLVAALIVPTLAWSVAAPSGLALGTYRADLAKVRLTWTNDATATKWDILVDGNVVWRPKRTQVGTDSAGNLVYDLIGITEESLPRTITMYAYATGQPRSALSAPVVLTGDGPSEGTFVINNSSTPLYVAGSISATASGGSMSVAGGSVGVTRTVGVVVDASGVQRTVVEKVVTGTSISGNTQLHDPTTNSMTILAWNMSVDVADMGATDQWFLRASGGNVLSSVHYTSGPNDDCSSAGGDFCAQVPAGEDFEVNFNAASIDFSIRFSYYEAP